MQPHLRGTGTLPTSEAAPPTTATPDPQGATTTTSPSTPVLPGLDEAEAFGAAVRAAGPGSGQPLEPRLAVVVSELQRRILADAAIGAQFERAQRKLGELGHEFDELRTVFTTAGGRAFAAAQVASKAQEQAQRAEAAAHGALVAVVSERGSSPALQVDQLLAEAGGPPSDLTTTINTGPGGRPASQRGGRAAAQLPPRASPAEEAVEDLRPRIEQLEAQQRVAGKGHAVVVADQAEQKRGLKALAKAFGWQGIALTLGGLVAVLIWKILGLK